LPDGNFAFLHRKDEQVMIFGKRVEPGEVENVLNESPEIARGVVCPYSDERGLSYLVAMKHIPLNSHGKVDRNALPVVLKDGSKEA